MAYASITYTSASGTTFALTNSSGDPIEYLRQSDIAVTVNNVLKTLTTDYTFNSAGTAIVLNTAVSGATVVIARTTDIADATVSFTAGSTLTAQDLNNSDKQNRFALQEFSDIYDALRTGTGDLSTLGGFIGSAETWLSDNAHAPTTGAVDVRVDSKIDTALTTDVVAGDSITVTDNSPSSGQITIGVTNSGISTAKLADSAVTTAKLADSNVTTAKIADTNVTTGKLADSAVTTVKVADNAITSAKIADGTIIAGDIAADAVTTVKILDSNVTTAKIADLNVTTGKVADGAITDAKLASGIDGAKLTSGSVPSTALADADLQTLAGAQTGAAAAFAALTAAEVGTLDGITSTTAELNILDGVTADANEINRLDGITTSTSELNQLAGKTITGTLTPGNTNDIPTSSAVNNWVIGLVDALGGFVAIANEVSFPNSNPDPSDNPGTVVSVADAGGLVINGSGTSTSAQTVSGSTVTITGFPSSLYSTTLPTGMGLQVQTTATLNTYTYHKIIAREEDIIQLSDDINDFFARYRVGTTNPTIDLDAGDLFFNTTTGKMLVYDGTTTSWEEVQSIGNFFINTLSSSAGTGGGSASFNGTAYRFTLSNPPLFAQQLLVSINGVVQKPNSGTSQPAEGFAIDGNDIVFSQAPVTSSPFFIITMGSTVNIGTPSDDTVSTAKIQNGAVTTAKLGSNLTVDLGSGTAAAPSLTFDANSGIYSPGEDQVAISTGGTGRLFIDSSGRLLVGTSTARSNFFGTTLSSLTQTEGTGGSTGRGALSVINNDVSNNPPYVLLGRSGAATLGSNAAVVSGSRLGTVSFHGADGTSFIEAATVAGEVDGTPGTNDMPGRLVLSTTSDGASSPTERLRIDSSGRVGIGTSSPAQRLHVSGSNAGGFQVTNADNSDAISLFVRGGNAINSTTDNAVLHVGQRSDVSIITTGRVGIGTTSPAHLFHLSSASTGTTANSNVIATVRSQASGRDANIQIGDGTDFAYLGALNGNLYFSTANTERARIDSSGRLLVGTSSDSSSGRLVVQGSPAASGVDGVLVLKRAGNNPASGTQGLGVIDFKDLSDGHGASIQAVSDGSWSTPSDCPTRLVFSVTADGASSPTARMTIKSDGTTQFVGAITPNADAAQNVGSASVRWSTVYAATGTINTSDANLKQDIENLEQTELNVAAAIKNLIKKYRFIDAVATKGDDARIHVGVIAQEVEQAFVNEGLDPRRYALFCEDTIEDGSKRLGIRYDELLVFVIAAL